MNAAMASFSPGATFMQAIMTTLMRLCRLKYLVPGEWACRVGAETGTWCGWAWRPA